MCEHNQTEAVEFVLLGFQSLQAIKILLFIVFFISFLVILNGNLLIVVLISINDQLKVPMFFFLKHLAMNDLMLTTTIVPMMLDIILNDGITMPVTACVLQLQCSCFFGTLECFLIAIMSFDRYVAICNPMRYNSIMKPHVCLHMVVGCWLLDVFLIGEFIWVYRLHFCGGNTIDHFFCDIALLMELSTSDVYVLALIDFSVSVLVFFVPFAFIIGTYVLISFTIINMSTATGRWKAFSTCSSHLATVCTYYGSLMTLYMTPSDDRLLDTNKFLSLFYIVGTPMINPIIYSLRNHEIRKYLQKYITNIKSYMHVLFSV